MIKSIKPESTVCDVHQLYKDTATGEKYYKWVTRAVSEVVARDDPKIRCAHCHGEVSTHRQQDGARGHQDHVVHASAEDSKFCCAGYLFEGEQRRSRMPVG